MTGTVLSSGISSPPPLDEESSLDELKSDEESPEEPAREEELRVKLLMSGIVDGSLSLQEANRNATINAEAKIAG